jgi:hypothetical protein
MSGLSAQKVQIVRRLVETSPDRVVSALQAALAQTSGEDALADVRRLVEAEAGDRRLRNLVLQPVAPLFRLVTSGAETLAFPPKALAHLWRGLKQAAPAQVEAVSVQFSDVYAEQPSEEALDRLTARAAAALRARAPADFAAAAELCDHATRDGAETLAKCLDLAPVCRAATPRLGDWITRTTEANTAAARLAYRDAVEVAEDAGRRFFEMLAAQLASPWMVLRVISAVMDRPAEDYFAGSEFADFALRLLDEIDRGLEAVAHLDTTGGARAGAIAAKRVETLSLQIHEIEESIEIKAGGPWGARLSAHKQALAAKVVERFKAAEKQTRAALPSEAVRIAKMLKHRPRLDVEPDSRTVDAASTLLAFAHEVRASANHGGFASSRAKLIEAITETVNDHVEETLADLRSGEAPDGAIAMKHLETAATLMAALGDEKSPELIRRRAAAAAQPRAQDPPAA